MSPKSLFRWSGEEEAMDNAIKKAMEKAEKAKAAKNPFGLSLNLADLVAAEQTPEDIAKAKAKAEAEKNAKAEADAEARAKAEEEARAREEFQKRLLGELPMACVKRESFRGVAGGEKNFSLYDNAIAQMLRETLAARSGTGEIAVGVYMALSLGTFYAKEDKVPEGIKRASAKISDIDVLFADLVGKRCMNVSSKKPKGRYWQIGAGLKARYYTLPHQIPNGLYGKVCDGLNTIVNGIVGEIRQAKADAKAEAEAKATASGWVADIVAGQVGFYLLSLHPHTETREIPMVYSGGPKKGKPIMVKDKETGEERQKTRLETFVPEFVLRREGAMLMEVSADGTTLVPHVGFGWCERPVRDAVECRIKLKISDLDFSLERPPRYPGRREHDGKDWKAALKLWYWLRDIAAYQELVGNTAEAEADYNEAKAVKQATLEDIVLKGVEGRAFVPLPDIMGRPWELIRAGGSFSKKGREGGEIFFDKVVNCGIWLKRLEGGRLYVSDVVGPTIWCEAFKSYFRFAEQDPEADNLDHVDSQIHGLPMTIFRLVSAKLETEAKARRKAEKKVADEKKKMESKKPAPKKVASKAKKPVSKKAVPAEAPA